MCYYFENKFEEMVEEENMEGWLAVSLIALVLYGLWGFFPKLAVTYINPQSALVYEVFGAMLVGVLALFLVKFRPEVHPKGILFAVLTGVAGMIGTLFFFMAVSRGKVSVVVSMTALYPLISIILAFAILQEPVTPKQITGMFCALTAIYLLAS